MSEGSVIGSSRVPFSVFTFFGDATGLDGPAAMGWDRDIAREAGIGPEDRAAATEAEGARTTFFDLGFFAVGALGVRVSDEAIDTDPRITDVFKRATCPLET